MSEFQDFGGDRPGGLISACEEQQSREVRPVEGPCPLCGKIQEYFSDELRTKDQLRCYDCKEVFATQLFLKSAVL
jgi:hypothetical protein